MRIGTLKETYVADAALFDSRTQKAWLAVAAALLVARGDWDAGKMVNVEQLAPEPFLELLDQMGLPTRIKDEQGDRPWNAFPARAFHATIAP